MQTTVAARIFLPLMTAAAARPTSARASGPAVQVAAAAAVRYYSMHRHQSQSSQQRQRPQRPSTVEEAAGVTSAQADAAAGVARLVDGGCRADRDCVSDCDCVECRQSEVDLGDSGPHCGCAPAAAAAAALAAVLVQRTRRDRERPDALADGIDRRLRTAIDPSSKRRNNHKQWTDGDRPASRSRPTKKKKKKKEKAVQRLLGTQRARVEVKSYMGCCLR